MGWVIFYLCAVLFLTCHFLAILFDDIGFFLLSGIPAVIGFATICLLTMH